jgi:acetyl-CoA synthetase
VRKLSYRELERVVNRLADGLRQRGVQKGDRVAIYLPMLPETVIATLAIGKIGAVFVPMFSGFGTEALASRIQDSGAQTIITADGFFRRGRHVPLKAVADEAARSCPDVVRMVVLRRSGETVAMQSGRDTWWHDLVAGAATDVVPELTHANDPFMILYTSGTTGRPKGTVHVQAGFPIKAMHDLTFCFDLDSDDTLFWLTDLGWMMGPWMIAGGLMTGATLMLYEGTPDYPGPDRLWQLVEDHGVTVLGVAPTAIRGLMGHGEEPVRAHELSSLRVLGSTGETWNPDPWWWYFNVVGGGRCPIINYSGGTEIGGGILGCTTIQPQEPCGFTGPVPGIAEEVVNEQGESVRGSVGELVIRQPWVGMTSGFWRDPDRYLESYWSRFPNVWVHGDWAEVEDDGTWFIRGRSDDTIKVAGKRIGPAEVESAAVAHPLIREAAAIGVPDEVKGEVVVVFAVPGPGVDVSGDLGESVLKLMG